MKKSLLVLSFISITAFVSGFRFFERPAMLSDVTIVEYNNSSALVQSDDEAQLLQLILSDLIQRSILTSNRVLILTSYPSLASQNNSRVGQISFEFVDKTGLRVEDGNTITFWRMDVSGNQAHFEFYLSFTESQTVKLEYKFQKIGNEWQINVQ